MISQWWFSQESSTPPTGSWQASKRMIWRAVCSQHIVPPVPGSHASGVAFIDWAKLQIQNFAAMFRKQVYTSDVDPKTVEGAVTITHTQSKKVCYRCRCATARLSRCCSYWKSLDSTSVSSSRSFFSRSRKMQFALAQFTHALTRSQCFPHQRSHHLPHRSVPAPLLHQHARGQPIRTVCLHRRR